MSVGRGFDPTKLQQQKEELDPIKLQQQKEEQAKRDREKDLWANFVLERSGHPGWTRIDEESEQSRKARELNEENEQAVATLSTTDPQGYLRDGIYRRNKDSEKWFDIEIKDGTVRMIPNSDGFWSNLANAGNWDAKQKELINAVALTGTRTIKVDWPPHPGNQLGDYRHSQGDFGYSYVTEKYLDRYLKILKENNPPLAVEFGPEVKRFIASAAVSPAKRAQYYKLQQEMNHAAYGALQKKEEGPYLQQDKYRRFMEDFENNTTKADDLTKRLTQAKTKEETLDVLTKELDNVGKRVLTAENATTELHSDLDAHKRSFQEANDDKNFEKADKNWHLKKRDSHEIERKKLIDKLPSEREELAKTLVMLEAEIKKFDKDSAVKPKYDALMAKHVQLQQKLAGLTEMEVPDPSDPAKKIKTKPIEDLKDKQEKVEDTRAVKKDELVRKQRPINI